MDTNINKILLNALKGKTLEALEFGGVPFYDELGGERQVSIGCVIDNAYLDYNGEDAVVKLEMTDGTTTYAYSNEDITTNTRLQG